jgi:hypothetical protein
MTLPLDIPPLVKEAERLARAFYCELFDGDDETLRAHPWERFPDRERHVAAHARLLAVPTRRDSQAWMAEYCEVHGRIRPGAALRMAHHKPTLLVWRCILPEDERAAADRLAASMTSPADVLVACVLALHAREVGS